MKEKTSLYLAALAFLSASTVNASFMVINPELIAYDDRYLAISEVTYSVNGITVTQTSQATGSSNYNQTGPVYVTQVKAGGRTLDFFNFEGAMLRDVNGVLGQSNIQTSETGIGTVDHNGQTKASDGKAAFDAALTNTTQNNNILDYVYYDGNNTTPVANYDFDLLFQRGLEVTDAFLIQERDGNTYFKVEAIGADGNVIAGSNTLVFGGNTDADPESTGSSQQRYDWNSGYTLQNYQASQSIAFTVAETSVFFDGTSVLEEDQIVYGFRIDNNGNADVKFFGLSDDSFENNPISPIPEPAVFSSLLGLAALLIATRRRAVRS